MGLEIVRFAAALAVLFWHYQNLWFSPEGLTGFVRSDQPLYRYFSPLYDFGLYGVQVFWAISGYIFFWKYRLPVAQRRIGPTTFLVLRFSRLYPLHLATLLLVALLQPLYVAMKGVPFVYGHDDWFHFILQLGFASNWGLQSGSSFNGPIWSISVEVLVYCLFFAVLRHLGTNLWLNVGIVVAASIAYGLSHHDPIFQCVVCFYVGGISAVAPHLRIVRGHRNRLLALSLLLLAAIPLLALRFDVLRIKAVMECLVVVYIAVLLHVMAVHVNLPRWLEGPVQTAGNMTYSSYLVHFPLQLTIAIGCAALGVQIPALSVTFFLCYMAAVLLLAVVLYRGFELPGQAWLRRRLAPARRES